MGAFWLKSGAKAKLSLVGVATPGLEVVHVSSFLVCHMTNWENMCKFVRSTVGLCCIAEVQTSSS